VGVADLSATGKRLWPVEWAGFPAMRPDPGFLDGLDALAAEDGGLPERLLFICRSGARSLAAAQAVAEAARAGRYEVPPARVTNVAEGFEGDLDEAGHRGRLNGWKARGLPWRQS
jgi:rhodanese-related sulfurtransferase